MRVRECAHTYTYVRTRERTRAQKGTRTLTPEKSELLDVSRNARTCTGMRVRVYVHPRERRGGCLSVVLASSGHHRRRTVGMVGNDPVMTLTPRIAGRYMVHRVYVCACVCVRECVRVGAFSPCSASSLCPSCSFFFPRVPLAGPKAPMMHGETFVFAF